MSFIQRWLRAAMVWTALSVACAAVAAASPPRTAILGAFGAEVAQVRSALAAPRDTTCLGLPFTLGTLRGSPVVLAMAGVGKVNAAMTTTLLVEHFRPGEVLFTGIAGGLNPDLYPGDIVLGARTVHHDFAVLSDTGSTCMATVSPITGAENPVFLPGDSLLLGLAREVAGDLVLAPIPTPAGPRPPRVVEGLIATGESFIASPAKKQELRARLGADAVEMEGAAVAQVCRELGTPCLIVRSLSDRADSSAVSDVEQFYRIAAENSAALVMAVVGRLGKAPRR